MRNENLQDFNAIKKENDRKLTITGSRIFLLDPLGDFFLAKPPVFGEAKHPNGFGILFWFFEQLANTH